MSDQPEILSDNQGITVGTDFYAVHGFPELFECDFTDDPGRFLLACIQSYGNVGSRKQIVVEFDGGYETGTRASRIDNGESRLAERTRHPGVASCVKDRDFFELRKLDDVVTQKPFLLPRLEIEGAQLTRDRLQHPGVRPQIEAHLLGDLDCDFTISVGDGSARPAAQGTDRNSPVHDKR
ncbi:MAG TPA: hypothetical protein VJP86_11210 [Vicinamibacterales bacterium]|nr:hypothetical protein [Vicinamibacterales bacterium]